MEVILGSHQTSQSRNKEELEVIYHTQKILDVQVGQCNGDSHHIITGLITVTELVVPDTKIGYDIALKTKLYD